MKTGLATIAARIFWLHLAVIAAASGAVAISVYLLLNATLADFERHTLGQHAAVIANSLRPDAAGPHLDLAPELKAYYAGGYDGYAFAVIDADGRTLFGSSPRAASLFPGERRASGPAFFQSVQGPDAYFGASYPEQIAGKPVWVQVRQNLQNPDVFVDDVVAQFLGRIGWLVAPIMVLLLAADMLIIRRALAPVREASEQAEAIDPTRIELRLPTDGLPGEIRPLVMAVNRALDRLELGFRVQREFTADAAHELRTPLAVLRLRADTLSDREAAGRIRGDVDAMSRVVDQLLAIAELETFSLAPTDRADLRALGLEVSTLLAPLAIAAGKELALSVGEGPVWVHGRDEVLFRALRNLVENAIVHTPPGGSVTILVGDHGAMSVSDDGAGVPENERELIFQRFWRRDRRTKGRSGLGLSIVQRIVEAHGGAIEVRSSASGGACFVMRLKAA